MRASAGCTGAGSGTTWVMPILASTYHSYLSLDGDETAEDSDDVEEQEDAMRRPMRFSRLWKTYRHWVKPGPGLSMQRVRMNMLLGGRAHYLDDNDDDTNSERVSVPHPTAGAVIRMSQTVHEQWAELFGMKMPSDVAMDSSGAPDTADTLCRGQIKATAK
ncbi:hypothetical protein BDZ89DRAFT_1046134 [Hymenopellis radicata]|nr:hypothetical protein BDZ89DRAFT_1046134 [Hymenopellis radicata]